MHFVYAPKMFFISKDFSLSDCSKQLRKPHKHSEKCEEIFTCIQSKTIFQNIFINNALIFPLFVFYVKFLFLTTESTSWLWNFLIVSTLHEGIFFTVLLLFLLCFYLYIVIANTNNFFLLFVFFSIYVCTIPIKTNSSFSPLHIIILCL